MNVGSKQLGLSSFPSEYYAPQTEIPDAFCLSFRTIGSHDHPCRRLAVNGWTLWTLFHHWTNWISSVEISSHFFASLRISSASEVFKNFQVCCVKSCMIHFESAVRGICCVKSHLWCEVFKNPHLYWFISQVCGVKYLKKFGSVVWNLFHYIFGSSMAPIFAKIISNPVSLGSES